MGADEYAAFKSKGRKIDYCGERLAKQKLNDARAATRKDLRPLGAGRDLIDLVINAIAWSSRPAEMMATSQALITQIMSEPRNRKYKQTPGMSEMHKLHQQDIRLVHALALKGITQAEHCRRIGLKPHAASRSLARIGKKEPGLLDALNARSACAAMVSWQNVQQRQMLRYKERERKEVPLIFGLNSVQQIATEPYPSQASSPRMARDGALGGYRYLPLIPDEPYEPDEWWVGAFVCTLFEPQQRIAVYAPPPYRSQRPLGRRVRIKDDPETCKRRYETWSIARAVPIQTWAYQQYAPEPDDILAAWLRWVSQPKDLSIGVAPEPPHGIFHRRFRPVSPIHAVMKIRPDQLAIFVSHGCSMEDCQDVAPASRTDNVTVQRGRIEAGAFIPKATLPLCTPVHSGQVLVAAKSGILETELRWALYGQRRPARRLVWTARPTVRKPHGLIRPFARHDWIRWPVEKTELLLATQTHASMPLYFVRNVTTG